MSEYADRPPQTPLSQAEGAAAIPGLEQLRAGWLGRPQLQTEGAWARNEAGHAIPATSDRAICWCMEGFVSRFVKPPTRHATFRALRVAAARCGYRSIAHASDSGTAARHQVVTTAVQIAHQASLE